MQINIEKLAQQFNIPGKVSIVTGQGGLTKINAVTNSSTAEIYLHGAHLTSFQKDGKQLIWLSPNAEFLPQKAIRGGIPICWPWFGKKPDNPALPQHGFARISNFDILETNTDDEGNVSIVLSLESGDRPLSMFPYKFELRIKFVIGSQLSVSLTTYNRSDTSFKITEAIHTYFQVEDIRQTILSGLNGITHYDQLAGKDFTQAGEVFFMEETDAIYQKTENELLIKEAGKVSARIAQQNANSTVVWNPWVEKSKSMTDFPNEGYLNMLCVEAANTGEGIELPPGSSHTMTQVISD